MVKAEKNCYSIKGAKMERINSLICTVGTSLVSHWRTQNGWKNEEVNGIVVNSYETMEHALRKLIRNIEDDHDGLLELLENEKRFGAEINSTASLVHRRYTDQLEKVILLRSDTDDGLRTSQVLKNIFEIAKLVEKPVEIKTISGLQHEDEKRFRREGLVNLVKTMVDAIEKLKAAGLKPAINATGGYKAQIAFAVLIGQVMKVPVFYRFEKFPQIISLPPLPVNYDFGTWARFYDILKKTYDETTISVAEIPLDEEPAIEVLFEIENNEAMLSSVGIIFFEAFRNFINENWNLPKPSDLSLEERVKNINLEHSGNIVKRPKLKNFLEKLFKECEFIERAQCESFNPDLPSKIKFIKPKDGRVNEIMLIYSDGTATAKIRLVTTAENDGERIRAIEELTARYSLD